MAVLLRNEGAPTVTIGGDSHSNRWKEAIFKIALDYSCSSFELEGPVLVESTFVVYESAYLAMLKDTPIDLS